MLLNVAWRLSNWFIDCSGNGGDSGNDDGEDNDDSDHDDDDDDDDCILLLPCRWQMCSVP